MPEVGDVVWLGFNPPAGHEQAGHRPALVPVPVLVLSPATCNAKTGLMVCCPLSTKVKGYPFEVQVQLDGQVCVVLSDQVKSLDWTVRRATKKGSVAGDALMAVRGRIKALLAIK